MKILAKADHGPFRVGHKEGPRLAISVGVLFALPVFGILTAFGVASDSQLDKVPRQSVEQALEVKWADEVDAGPARFQASERVQRGWSVKNILQRLQVEDRAVFDFLRTSPST